MAFILFCFSKWSQYKQNQSRSRYVFITLLFSRSGFMLPGTVTPGPQWRLAAQAPSSPAGPAQADGRPHVQGSECRSPWGQGQWRGHSALWKLLLFREMAQLTSSLAVLTRAGDTLCPSLGREASTSARGAGGGGLQRGSWHSRDGPVTMSIWPSWVTNRTIISRYPFNVSNMRSDLMPYKQSLRVAEKSLLYRFQATVFPHSFILNSSKIISSIEK